MALVRIEVGCTAEDVALLAAACRTAHGNVYIVPRSPQEWPSYATEGLLKGLQQWYDVVSRTRPMLNAIPLFEWTGWTLSRVAEIEELETVMTTESMYDGDVTFLRRLNSLRDTDNLKSVSLQNIEPAPDTVALDSTTGDEADGTKIAFDHVVVGGTYDHLHAGHRLLLAVSALISQHKLLIGITDEQYLLTKKNRDRIQSLEERTRNVLEFVRHVRPELKVTMSILTDPQEPVLAETVPEFQALVVSKETVSGGEQVNASRVQRKLTPLTLIVVGLVGLDGTEKLSSSGLRQT